MKLSMCITHIRGESAITNGFPALLMYMYIIYGNTSEVVTLKVKYVSISYMQDSQKGNPIIIPSLFSQCYKFNIYYSILYCHYGHETLMCTHVQDSFKAV